MCIDLDSYTSNIEYIIGTLEGLQGVANCREKTRIWTVDALSAHLDVVDHGLNKAMESLEQLKETLQKDLGKPEQKGGD